MQSKIRLFDPCMSFQRMKKRNLCPSSHSYQIQVSVDFQLVVQVTNLCDVHLCFLNLFFYVSLSLRNKVRRFSRLKYISVKRSSNRSDKKTKIHAAMFFFFDDAIFVMTFYELQIFLISTFYSIFDFSFNLSLIYYFSTIFY